MFLTAPPGPPGRCPPLPPLHLIHLRHGSSLGSLMFRARYVPSSLVLGCHTTWPDSRRITGPGPLCNVTSWCAWVVPAVLGLFHQPSIKRPLTVSCLRRSGIRPRCRTNWPCIPQRAPSPLRGLNPRGTRTLLRHTISYQMAGGGGLENKDNHHERAVGGGGARLHTQ